MGKSLLFSVTKDDLVITAMRAGGKGGQHQNKTDSAVRIFHPDSGAVGESRSERSQHVNKNLAFQRLVTSPKFKVWLSKKTLEITEGEKIRKEVDKMMSPEYIRTEVRENGRWVICKNSD